jgi:hypothetical protein
MGGLAIELHIADPGDLVQRESWILGVRIHNGLAHRGWQGALILLRDRGLRSWGQQGSHARLIEQIRFGVQRCLGDAGFHCPLLRTHPEKDNRAQDLVLDLHWIFE